MCGIAGKIYKDITKQIKVEDLQKMSDVIHHRGPDDSGHYIHNNIGLTFRRLSIIDLHTGHQPLSNHNDSIWITFNGEIYNFKELRENLQSKGYQFKTNTDTEVILHLYEEYGDKCVSFLRGMFGFVIWDNNKKQLFGARDRFGIKPFHYYIDNDKLIWGSEIKSILSSSEHINTDINLEALDYYFTYGYTPRNQSIYKSIQKLEPGNTITFNLSKPNEVKIEPYWQIEFAPDFSKTENYWKEAIYESLNEAVKMRMVSDVPLGAFLSGGVDSSTVVSLMSLNSNDPIKTFSIGFKEEKYNELKYAQLVANKYKTDHHEFIIEPESIELLPNLVKSYDEPFADSSAIPTYYVSKYTRQHVTVALSGDGGDELFAGYNSYQKLHGLYKKGNTFNMVFSLINKMLPDHFYGKGLSYYLSKNKKHLRAYYNFWKDYERNSLFNANITNTLVNEYSEKIKLELSKSIDADFISRMQYLDMKTYMVDDILTKVDRASMQNSLEARVPILDHKFAELSFKIPSKYKMQGGSKKHIFKEAFKHILPPEIISHKKQGFAIPLSIWFKGNLKDYAYDSLLSSDLLYNYLNKKQVKKILDNHQKGLRDYSEKIWSILFFNEWLKHHNSL